MGSLPPMYLIISLEQHCLRSTKSLPGHRKGCVLVYFFAYICVAVILSLCLILSAWFYDWLLPFLSPSPHSSLSHIRRSDRSVFTSLSPYMAARAASKHLHTQLSPFLRHLGLSALLPVPKHPYSVLYLLTHASRHTHIHTDGENIVGNVIKKQEWTQFVSLALHFFK